MTVKPRWLINFDFIVDDIEEDLLIYASMLQLETAPVVPKQLNKASRDYQTSLELPDELQALVEEAKVVINPEQAQDFWQLLLYYRDVFSTRDEPLGQPVVIQHDIQTTIKSQYHRMPVGLREEAIQEEERMKKLGVIEPSESP